MTHQSARFHPSTGADAGRQLAQLRHVQALVEQIAGRSAPRSRADAELDEGARLSDAYDRALPVVQRRFDILATETACWAAAGVEALLASGGAPRAAAAALADELDHAQAALGEVLRHRAAPAARSRPAIP
jgi:hypothetical protein